MTIVSADDERSAGYLRAAGRAPLALYDPAVALGMREREFRARLARQVVAGWARDGRSGAGLTICDAGCGTGSLAVVLARTRGVAAVVGVDGDPGALARARAKEGRRSRRAVSGAGVSERAAGASAAGAGASAAGASGPVAIDWREGLAQRLPLGDESCDRIVLSLVLHHLSPADQRVALREAARVLRPGGRIHVADWGPPRDPLMRAAFRILQLFDGVENTAPLGRGELPGMLDAAGFAAQRLHDRMRTGFGLLELRSARRG